MNWTHAVLEIYEPDSGWPDDTSNAANWIANSAVGYCQGRAEDLVVLIPLRKILWWKLCHFVEEAWWSLTWRFNKRPDIDELFEENDYV